MSEFTIGGVTFEIEPLKLKQALKAEALLVEVFLPAFAGMAGAAQQQGIDPTALAGLERLDELVDMFMARCKVDFDKGGSVARVPLAGFAEIIFARKNALLLAWLAACVEYQFADFFDGTGLPLITEAANRFGSLLASIGGSGDLLLTSESPRA